MRRREKEEETMSEEGGEETVSEEGGEETLNEILKRLPERRIEETKGFVDRAIEETFDNITEGVKIGASGKAAKLAVEMTEKLIGKKLPNFTENKALNDAIKIQIAAMVLKTCGPILGGDKGDLVVGVGVRAEVYGGVKLAEIGADVILPMVDAFLERAKAVVSKP